MLKTYDPDQILMNFAGIPIGGFADGTFVSIEPVSDAFTEVVGADGECARSKSNDRRVRVTFTLLQTSDSNDVLSAVHTTDLKSPNGSGVAPLGVKDLSGRTVLVEPTAWIVKAPTVGFDKTAGNREWVLMCPDPELFVGGN